MKSISHLPPPIPSQVGYALPTNPRPLSTIVTVYGPESSRHTPCAVRWNAIHRNNGLVLRIAGLKKAAADGTRSVPATFRRPPVNDYSPIHYPLSTIFCLLLLLAGCPRDESSSPNQPAKRPLEGVKLRLTVVDDPALAAAILRVRGEWNVQTGSEFQLEETTEEALLEAGKIEADAVLCPSHLMGVLCERGLLAPVPAKVLKGKQWAAIFDLLKLREAAWGGETMAVPFGSPLLTCYYRADLLTKLNRRPPRSWDDFDELAKLLAAEKPAETDAPWCGAVMPLAPGWAGLTLLARAAPMVKHRDNFSTLFNIETMEPLVAAPGMTQALKELVAEAKLGPADPTRFDPAAARAAFWNGQCGMALTWPTAAADGGRGKEEGGKDGIPEKVDPSIRGDFVELPGSSRVFNLTSRTWDLRANDDDHHVPLLALSGRLGVVNKQSSELDAAFQLLLWLSERINERPSERGQFGHHAVQPVATEIARPMGRKAGGSHGRRALQRRHRSRLPP